MNTADLVARLRGIIAAKPPHLTVLADNTEVYPIRGALLTEVAERLAAAEAERDEWREAAHHEDLMCEARRAAQQTILSTLEGEHRRLTERLAAAERVLQDLLDAFVAMPDAGLTDADPRHDWWLRTVRFRDLARNFLSTEKAYSADVAGTPEQFKQWVLDDLKDPKNFAELKSRSDEANAKMAARPFTDDSNPTGAAWPGVTGAAGLRPETVKPQDETPRSSLRDRQSASLGDSEASNAASLRTADLNSAKQEGE